MTPLAESFKANGFVFTQLVRAGDLAIYRKAKGNWVGFEVIRVQRHTGYTIAGKFCPPAEFYPANEKWGVDGYSCVSEDRARVKMAEMGLPVPKKATLV